MKYKTEEINGYEGLRKSIEGLVNSFLTDEQKEEILIEQFRGGVHLYNHVVLKEMFNVASEAGINIPYEKREELLNTAVERRKELGYTLCC